jgi:hypothetical protein
MHITASGSDPQPDDWLTPHQAARMLGVHRNTLLRWPVPYRRVGALGWRRYSRRDVEAFLERSRVEP